MALVPLRPAGRRCALRLSRASELGVRRVVHGDDFAFAGYDADLDIVEKQMDEKFVCKVEGRLGGGPSDLQE
eukprot:2873739-Alexandrium_andersonii.AAC.1